MVSPPSPIAVLFVKFVLPEEVMVEFSPFCPLSALALAFAQELRGRGGAQVLQVEKYFVVKYVGGRNNMICLAMREPKAPHRKLNSVSYCQLHLLTAVFINVWVLADIA